MQISSTEYRFLDRSRVGAVVRSAMAYVSAVLVDRLLASLKKP